MNNNKIKLVDEKQEGQYFKNERLSSRLKKFKTHLTEKLRSSRKVIAKISKNNSEAQHILKSSEEQNIYNYFLVKKKTISNEESIKEIENDVETMINKGGDINYKDKLDNTVLLKVSKFKAENAVDIFLMLLRKNAQVVENSYGHTVLHNASFVGNVPLVRAILEKFPYLKEASTNIENQTALHYAAKKGNDDVVRCLIKDFGVNMEARDHQGRTPLFLAAEHGQKNVVKLLLEFGSDEKLRNIHGQKVMFYIVKHFPDIASDIMDKYYHVDRYSRITSYYLNYVEHEPMDENGTLPEAKSILALIVEDENLNLLMHPVISNLVRVKWKKFAKLRSYLEFFITFISVLAWNLIGILVPYEKRHIYNFPNDWWILFLYLIGIITTLYYILVEITELYIESKSRERFKQQRLKVLDMDRRVCYPHDLGEKTFLLQEQKSLRSSKLITDYLGDIWNIFDLISVILLASVVFTHVADLVSHTELISKANLRLMSVTNIFIAIRILKVARIINLNYGVLVITITHIIRDFFAWILLYLCILIAFTTALFSIFGGKKVPDDTGKEIPIRGVETYANSLFSLYVTTFGGEMDVSNMKKVDATSTKILIAAFIGLTTLITVNIFISILTSILVRIRKSSRAYFILQRAVEIVRIENRKSKQEKLKHYASLQKPYVEKIRNDFKAPNDEKLKSIRKRIDDIKLETKSLNENLASLESDMMSIQQHNKCDEKEDANVENFNERINKISKEFDELKMLMELCIEQNKNQYLFDLAQYSREPQTDVLILNDNDNETQSYLDAGDESAPNKNGEK